MTHPPGLRRTPHTGALLLLLTLATACTDADGGARSAAGAAVRDSAGVRIVESAAPRDAGGAPRLLGGPAWSVGAMDGPAAQQLHRVRGAVVLGDTLVVVANEGAHEVRAYAADGRHRWSTGRRGRGPGEFTGELRLAALAGDSVAVYDWLQRRITVLDAGGRVARTIMLRELEPNPDLVGVLAGGFLVSTRHVRVRPGSSRDSLVLHRAGPDGAVVGGAGWTRQGTVHMHIPGAPPPVIDDLPFGTRTAVATTSSGVAMATGEAAELRVTTPEGRLHTIIRWQDGARAIEPARLAAWREAELARVPEGPSRLARAAWLDAAQLPARLPVTARVLVDALGRQWVERYRAPWDEGPRHWQLLDVDGTWLATVAVPAELELLAVGRALAVGVAHDELGVEQLRAYRMAGER